MYSHGIPIVGVTFQIDEKTFTYAVGDNITGITMDNGEAGNSIIAGKLAAIQLGRIVADNHDHKILDNIPMQGWSNPVCGQIEDAMANFEVNAILVETSTPAGPEAEPEGDPIIGYVYVPTNTILAIDEADADPVVSEPDEEEDEETSEGPMP